TNAPALQSFAQPTISVTGWRDRPMSDHAVGVMPGAPVKVAAQNGSLTSVVVSGPDGPVAGKVSADGGTWVSSQPLDFGGDYTLTAAAKG
ncbi:hypothetical protein KC221_24850, partial [Mycobacterium tuberculosis]|nr:hypothetical protein [Mycobacterium tuberculosis]